MSPGVSSVLPAGQTVVHNLLRSSQDHRTAQTEGKLAGLCSVGVSSVSAEYWSNHTHTNTIQHTDTDSTALSMSLNSPLPAGAEFLF